MSKDDPKASKNFSVDVSPEMQIYGVLQHLNYDLETAFAEFIDNSIQSFIDSEKKLAKLDTDSSPKLNIKIEISSKENQIVISDNAGGIKREDIHRALRLGVQLGIHSTDSLSVYGIGMKSSSIWFTDNWSIKTSALGENEKLDFNFELQKLLKNNQSSAEVISTDASASEHYTNIILRNHIRFESAEHYQDVIIPFIAETFMNYRNKVSIEFYYDGKLLSPNKKKTQLSQPKVMVYPPVTKNGDVKEQALVTWKIPFDFVYKSRKVHGFIMLRETGSYVQPGLRLLRNNRVIEGTTVRSNIPELLLGTKNKYAAQRIYGELNLDTFPVDFMKTNFNENLKGLYDELRKKLTTDYNVDLLFQANYFRNKVSKLEHNQSIVKELLDKQLHAEINKNGVSLVQTNGLNASDTIPENESTEPPSSPDEITQQGEMPEPEGNQSSAPSDENNSSQNTNTGSSNNNGFLEPLPENRVSFSEKLNNTLKQLTGNKPEHLYSSLCTISLKKHSVLAYVGAWSFLEMFTALIGRNSSTSFPDFLGSKINEYTKEKTTRTELKRVVSDISTKGNCTKHSGVYWNHTAMDLKPAFIILEPFIIYLVEKHCKN
ncbi:ATP-binding protein [Endozoicomonas sp. G2_1]|uniref:ATP-binding protein n=1 Tax=Endozoicomonas sp. G2_1 TaxID=2821091 RepID=UPI001ADD1182|nr:ATP-binding protein [Endozoicomonas sp. G2_1]MBO9490450.1 ATP-binding protein [Endozoicomonas sp. G2_1]